MANKTTQPIRNKKTVDAFLVYLKSRNYRDFMIAKAQLNTARRISDIVALSVNDVMHPDGAMKESIILHEKKTGKEAIIFINTSLSKALVDYIKAKGLKSGDFLFQSRKGNNKPITTVQAYRALTDAAAALQLEGFGTHTLRKTWGYHCYMETKNLAVIMETFGHTNISVTLRYIGVTQNDINTMYQTITF